MCKYRYVAKMHTVSIELHEIFQALSDPFRIRILQLLLAAKTEICLCELSDSMQEAEYKLSRHVKILKQSGLITSVRDGKWIYHGLVTEPGFLKLLHKALLQFPDNSSVFRGDLKRFQKRVKIRENGRCKTISQIKPVLEKGMN